GRREAPDEGGTDAGDLVRRDLLAVPRAPEDDAERLEPARPIARDRTRCIDAEGRVVVERVVLGRPVIDDIVPGAREVLLERLREVEPGVIGGDVDPHASQPRLEVVAGENLTRA